MLRQSKSFSRYRDESVVSKWDQLKQYEEETSGPEQATASRELREYERNNSLLVVRTFQQIRESSSRTYSNIKNQVTELYRLVGLKCTKLASESKKVEYSRYQISCLKLMITLENRFTTHQHSISASLSPPLFPPILPSPPSTPPSTPSSPIPPKLKEIERECYRPCHDCNCYCLIIDFILN